MSYDRIYGQSGRLLGSIRTDSQGNQTGYDSNGNKVGLYRADANRTDGQLTGNQLASKIIQANMRHGGPTS